MSRTTMLAVWPGEKTQQFEELSNGHLSLPLIWDAVAVRHLGMEKYHSILNIEKIWPLWADTRLPQYARAALLITYDRMYVARENYGRAAADLRRFIQDYIFDFPGHWPRIAEIYESNPAYPAIGIWGTSVSEEPFIGAWNEQTKAHQLFNWATAYEVYSELDESEKETAISA